MQKTLNIIHKGDSSSSKNHCKRFDGTGADYGIETRQLDRRVLQIPVTWSGQVLHISILSDTFTRWIQHNNLLFFTVPLNPENSKSSYTFQLAEHTYTQEETDYRSAEVKANFNTMFLTQVLYLFFAAQL